MVGTTKKVPIYCYQCVAGPDLCVVKVQDGVAMEIEPNFKAAGVHPGGGKCCVKAYGLVQKTYNPNRLLQPMKRTNPKKGRDEDPGFVPISWDEALDMVAGKLNQIRATGLTNEHGYPRVAASFGGGGTPTYYMGTFPAFLSAWGSIDFSFGSGQGVKCYHSEHLYGELWHRAYIVAPDTPSCNYILSFGANIEASGGVAAILRQANARATNHTKRVQFEPHLSVTGGCSSEWVPLKPKTDPAFLFAMLHVLLHETARDELDLDFIRDHTGSPYLVAANGYYLRDPGSRKPLVWDRKRGRALPFDSEDIDPALEGCFVCDGIEVGADEQVWQHSAAAVETSFTKLVNHVAPYTPEWAEKVCDIKPGTVRRIAKEYLAYAQVGATTLVDGVTLPLRPVAITLGKTVNNGWGGYECCWARTLISCLVGALEVPGGLIGAMVRINRPATSRQASVAMGPDGFMTYPMNPTDKENWIARPTVRNAHRTLVPMSANSPWSTALGPTHLAWMFLKESPKDWPKVTPPDIWFCYRTNPAISFFDTPEVAQRIAEFPFVVCFTYTRDETNHMADVLLPECTDLESTQLIHIGSTGAAEQFWESKGYALRQAAVRPRGDTLEFTDIATELAKRTGLLEKYNQAINRGSAGTKLSGENYDFSLAPDKAHSVEEIWDAACRAASAELTAGEESQGLAWFKEHGFRVQPFSRLNWYLYPELLKQGIRIEMPYQERLLRTGVQLGNRLHEQDNAWWDGQLKEYQGLPTWKDFPGMWEQQTVRSGGKLEDFPFWLLTSRSMQFSWGSNVGIPLMHEAAKNVRGHDGVVMNAGRAKSLGIKEGDLIEVRSTLRATKGRAILTQGIRPDTLLILGQFGQWATPLAKDLQTPSMNALTPMSLELTDATGSTADVVRVGVTRIAA